MKKVLVTGANGFVGQHLVKELADNGISVVGVGGPVGAAGKPPHVDDYVVLDLNDAGAVDKLDFAGVDGVIHLAGLAAVGPSFEKPLEYITTNVGIQINLFEAAIKQGVAPRFLVISSGSLYGADAPLPLNEKSPVVPDSPYAVSKIGQEQMAFHYGGRGFECIVARPFNHIGPGQNPGFLVPDVARQIITCEKGEQSEISVGNLDAKRDYTDVRDIVRAYRLLLEKGESGEIYNICSGKSVSGHDVVDSLLKAAGSKASLKADPALMRPSDNPDIYGDYSKLAEATGWKPEISLETTLKDVIEDWRTR
ncbi:MAG TPA: GDP-mannose 4,6-dehydratase [Candidatus Saccharimonadales bacterium]|nr:GDP-mannose 4,6-dehydratase [Candidatus Saccharimonadales bacterium]